MARNKILIENYGLYPPENSQPFWEDNNIYDEDKVIFNIDLQVSLQKLTPTERKILTLCNQRYSIREVEEMINLPSTTVFRIKECAINKLKGMMNGEDRIYSIFA
uniref:Putative sigma-70 region domain containing protein n=1 Tax=viral metagenome TaxID=1070528 RepID=A0A6H1ZN06_9ZZZZ